MHSARLRAHAGTAAAFLGVVPDLRPLYGAARIFIAPTRFAAGLPQKVYEAAAHGVPVVLTPLLARSLGWSNEVEALVAETEREWIEAIERLTTDRDLWLRLRDSALRAVRDAVAPAAFARSVREVLAGAVSATAVRR